MGDSADNPVAATTCAGCCARDRRIAELEARVAGLEAKLGAAVRAGKRQAAPFSKGDPRPHPTRPGRKPGAAYGTRAHRRAGTTADDNMADPDYIAETYLQLHRQHRSTWAFEVVLRPWVEKW